MVSCPCAAGKTLEIRLENLNQPWLEVLFLGVRAIFPKGQVVSTTAADNVFYLLTKGYVRLTYVGDEGQERSSLFLGPNSVFNEIPALRQTMSTIAFCCMEPVELWRFPASLLEDNDFIAQYPHLMANLLQSMARKSGLFFQHVTAMSFASSKSQMCAMLLELVEERMPRMTQSEVAAVLGLHLTTVARLVRALRDEGVLGKFTKTELEILDMDRLQELAQQHRRGRR